MTARAARFDFSKTLLIAALVSLAACSDPPDLDKSVTPELEQADYPKLVPFDRFVDPPEPDLEGDEEPLTDAEITEQIEGRAAGLQSRAARLQSEGGIDEETRRRLNSSIVID